MLANLLDFALETRGDSHSATTCLCGDLASTCSTSGQHLHHL